MENVIKAAEASRGLDWRDIVRLLDHTDLGVFTVRIAAVQTKFPIADVVAAGADAELVLNIENGLRQIGSVFARGPKQVKGDTLSGFLADTWEAFTLLDEPGERLCKFCHAETSLKQAGRKA